MIRLLESWENPRRPEDADPVQSVLGGSLSVPRIGSDEVVMAIEDGGSVTEWIGDLKRADEGVDRAVERLWDRYFEQLVRMARGKIGSASRTVADEEDIALSVFDSFCAGVARGRFPELADRDNLWRVLVSITAHKATDLWNREHRQKRGGGKVLDEAALNSDGRNAGLDQFLSREPTPEFAARMADQCRQLLGALADETLREIALLKMEGLNNSQIAVRLDCAIRTVERKLEVIRKTWKSEQNS